MKVIGLAGWSGAGKTTLLAKVVPLLVAKGVSVSTIKHAHKRFDLDMPGKDSWVHRQAGATETLISSDRRWALLHELRDAPALRLPDLLAKLEPVDLVIIEGFKSEGHPKIEVHRGANEKEWLFPQDTAIVGIATDVAATTRLPVAHLDDAAAVATMMLASAVSISDALERIG